MALKRTPPLESAGRKAPRNPPGHKPMHQPMHELPDSDEAALKDIDRIFTRLDVEIPKAQKRMDDLLARLRTTRIVKAA